MCSKSPRLFAVVCALVMAACGEDYDPGAENADPGALPDMSNTTADMDSDEPPIIITPEDMTLPPADMSADLSSEDMRVDEDMRVEEDMRMNTSECDWRTVNDILVFEAESLPITQDWVVATDEAGYTGDGYIEWTGRSRNNDPSYGRIDVALQIDTPGRYRLQWRNRIGMGDNPTEHNDTWVRFPDAADYYGLKGQQGAEIRRYPKPICEDDTFTSSIIALDAVDEATCVEGSSRDGWLKVYSSGARDWKWSTRTSDNDASAIMVEFGAPGTYILNLAARGDHHLIDRVVLHEESIDDDTVRDLNLAETPCP